MPRTIMAGLFALVLFVPTASGSATFHWTPFERVVAFQLDTQTGINGEPVYNTMGCAWNDQDHVGDAGGGAVPADGSVSDTLCLVADYGYNSNISTGLYPKAVALKVVAGSDNFVAVISNDVGDSWTAAPPVREGNDYVARLCIRDPVAGNAVFTGPLWDYWPQVPGTAGYGQIVHYTATITPLGKRLSSLNAWLEIHAGGPDAPYSPRYLHDVPCP